jgi:hypothetical protein
MTQSLARAEPVGLVRSVFGDDDRIAVLKEQLARGWKEPMSDAELEHIAMLCQRTRLDPLAKPAQIYFIKRYDSKLSREVMTPQISIDGLRLIAQRSRKAFQQVGPQWTADGSAWLDVWLASDPPAAARVGIRQRGFHEPTWSVATWRECAQYAKDSRGNRVLSSFWASMPSHMLAKAAEALALKRQFSLETNDLELAAIDQEWREQQAQQAQRYTEIFGADEDHSAYELPQRTVDHETGEVIDAQSPAQELTGPERSSAVATTPPATSSPPSDSPMADKYRRNRELIAECRKRNIAGMDPLKLGMAEDVVEAANLELADRIARYDFENAEVARQKAKEGLR